MTSEVPCDPDYQVCEIVAEVEDEVNDLDWPQDVPYQSQIVDYAYTYQSEALFYFATAALLAYGSAVWYRDIYQNFDSTTDTKLKWLSYTTVAAFGPEMLLIIANYLFDHKGNTLHWLLVKSVLFMLLPTTAVGVLIVLVHLSEATYE